MSQNQSSKNKQSNSYLKYSSLAFQMAAAIIIGVLLGKWLGNQFSQPKLFQAAGALIGVILGLYIALRDFLFKPKQ